MKTILKVLKVVILISIISLIIDAIGSFVAITHFLFDNSTRLKVDNMLAPAEWSNFQITLYLGTRVILVLFLVYLLFFFRSVIISFSKSSYFSSKNALQLLKVGKGLIIYGCGLFVLGLILNAFTIEYVSDGSPYSLGYILGKALRESMPIFIFSSFILLIASIIKSGNLLKQENELTI